MEETNIQLSLEKARESFLEWLSLKEDSNSDRDTREDKAINAILDLTEVVSRSSFNAPCDLLSEQELFAVGRSICLIRKMESDEIFQRSLHHAIIRIVDTITQSVQAVNEENK